MNRSKSKPTSVLLALLILIAPLGLPAGAKTRRQTPSQTPGEQPSQTPGQQPGQQAKTNGAAGVTPTPQTKKEWELHIDKREREQNGIRVDEPKVYDDSMLQQMLTAAQAKLASIQVLDQGVLVQKLGAVSGASQQVSSFGLSVQGPSLPQTVTTDKGATLATTNTQQATGSSGTTQTVVQSATPSTTNVSQQSAGTTNTLQTVGGAATHDVVQTVAQANPPAVPAPVVATSVPTSGFSVASSDILNEQMQLTYEIANLSMLLDGPLSDRILDNGNVRLVKPRVTLGFPITLTPDKRYKNAVAVVEVEVEKTSDATGQQVSIQTAGGHATTVIQGGEPPAVTALLPREKTYNVASITERNVSLGGGVVTQVLGVSGSFLRGNRTYYLVKDQDTLALTFQPDGEPAARQKVGFLWQFRPVLGQEYVQSGLKQTFVQLAFPSNFSQKSFGNVTVRTYWRKYDRKKGVAQQVIPGSLNESIVSQPITNYTLEHLEPVNTSLEDLGNGQMLVSLLGRFMTGTYVRIGSQFLRPGSPLASFEYNLIRFVAPVGDLATRQVALVARDGSETPLEIKHLVPGPAGGPKLVDKAPPEIDNDVTVSTVDEANSRVTVTLKDQTHVTDLPPLVMVIGGRVYGYADAPLERDEKAKTLSAVVPTAWVVAHPEVTVKPLFAPRGFEDTKKIIDDNPSGRTESLLLFQQEADKAKFILYGPRLGTLNVLYPTGVTPTLVEAGHGGKKLYIIELSRDQLKSYKQLVMYRTDERPFVLPMPAVEFKEPAKPKTAGRVTVKDDQASIQADGLKDLVRVTFEGRDVPFRISSDGKEIKLRGLRALGVTKTAGVRPLVLIYRDSVSTVSLEVVDTKVETVTQ
jgi:hypothetical protein